jgi:hypothetical protein
MLNFKKSNGESTLSDLNFPFKEVDVLTLKKLSKNYIRKSIDF